jgi:hypothetical protein
MTRRYFTGESNGTSIYQGGIDGALPSGGGHDVLIVYWLIC